MSFYKSRNIQQAIKHVNVVVTDALYFLFALHISQDVIDKDVDERSACRSGYFTLEGNPLSFITQNTVETQSRSGSCREKKILLYVPRIEIQFLGYPVHSPASILSYDVSYPNIHSRNKYDSSHSWNILPRNTPSVTKHTYSVHVRYIPGT